MGGPKPAVNGLLNSQFQRSKAGRAKRKNRPAAAFDLPYSSAFSGGKALSQKSSPRQQRLSSSLLGNGFFTA
jgi:hypothetical protein